MGHKIRALLMRPQCTLLRCFNLCLDVPKELADAFRLLRFGGRLQMADILLHDEVPGGTADG